MLGTRPRQVQADWYEHTPTRVEAVRYLPETREHVIALLNQWNVSYMESPSSVLHIQTDRGGKPALYGDWIVRGVRGECWPVNSEVFTRSYRPADGPRA